MTNQSEAPRRRLLDKYGWPIERVKGRPISNLIRLLLHTRSVGMWPTLKSPYLTMDIRVESLTVPQAAALREMFEEMKYLGAVGSSRWLKFFSDGDGNFRPQPSYQFSDHAHAIENAPKCGKYEKSEWSIDFDWIAWKLNADHPIQSPTTSESAP